MGSNMYKQLRDWYYLSSRKKTCHPFIIKWNWSLTLFLLLSVMLILI